MKKLMIIAYLIFGIQLSMIAQEKKKVQTRYEEVKNPPITEYEASVKINPVIRPEDTIKELLKTLKSKNINPEGLALVGLMNDGSLMYADTGGKKVGLKPNGEMVELPASMACPRPWKPGKGNGPYNPFPIGPYLLLGISDNGTVVNSASDGSTVSINSSSSILSRTLDPVRGTCTVRTRPIKK